LIYLKKMEGRQETSQIHRLQYLVYHYTIHNYCQYCSSWTHYQIHSPNHHQTLTQWHNHVHLDYLQ
uniref:Uncharacterized protein n=1 Tax=Amphimedon queenslandica TaxID=400682 RepID=A0A1X7UCB4_AMPQE